MADWPILDAEVVTEAGARSWSLQLQPGKTINTGFRERCTVTIQKPAGDGWKLIVDDMVLSSTTQNAWSWQPEFFAGIVRAEIERHGEFVADYWMDISPDPGKLSAKWYEEMLEGFQERAPDWIVGAEPGSRVWGTKEGGEDPWVQFRRLRQHAPAFLEAMRRVIQDPIRSQRATRAIVPIRRARRVDARTIRAAAANGTLPALAGFASSAESIGADRVGEPLYEVPWYDEHLDGPANRCLTALLLSLIHRARTLQLKLQTQVDSEVESSTRSSLRERWLRRRGQLAEISAELDRILKFQPFSCVTRPEITSAGLTSISAHPDYSRAYSAGWRATRSGTKGLDQTELMWLCPTWELYERWCYIETCNCLERKGVEKIAESRRPMAAHFTGRTRKGASVSLYFQKRFVAMGAHQSAPAFHSISRERWPDLVITIEDKERRRFAVLDSKYRSSRANILDAMSSAHIYHDSLRWGEQSPDFAILLVPTAGGVPWLEDGNFISREGVGVVALSPAPTPTVLDGIVTQLLYR